MRKFLVSIALASATLVVAPAVAQDHGRWDQRDDRRDNRWEDRRDNRFDDRRGDDRDWNRRGPNRQAINQLLRDLDRVEQRIHRSAQRRAISHREALGLRREANQIRIRLRRTGRDGLTGREFAQLRVQVNRLEQRLRYERRDNNGRRY